MVVINYAQCSIIWFTVAKLFYKFYYWLSTLQLHSLWKLSVSKYNSSVIIELITLENGELSWRRPCLLDELLNAYTLP